MVEEKDQKNTEAQNQKDAKPGDGKQVIVIDDDATSLELVTATLHKLGFQVIATSSAEEAWEKITPEVNPRLVITDVLMEGMGGLGLVKELKKNEETERLPILVISERKNMGDTFLALGVNAFQAKPIKIDEFTAKVIELASLPAGVTKKKAKPSDEGEAEEGKDEGGTDKEEKKE